MTRAVSYDLADGAQSGTAHDVCVSALQRGECIVLNVDGTWCVVADAFSAAGTQSLLNARRRGRGAPLPVLVKDATLAHALWAQVNADAAALMRQCWPGPLTLIGQPGSSLAWDLAAAGKVDSLSLRMPVDAFVRGVVNAVGPCAYIACPPDQDFDALRSAIGDDASVFVMPATLMPSAVTTVVDVRSFAPVLVRSGAIPAEAIAQTCPALVRSPK